MARGQVTGEAGRDCLIVYMVMKCAGFLPSYMTAIGAWQETRKGSAVATVFVLLLTHQVRRGGPLPQQAGGGRLDGQRPRPRQHAAGDGGRDLSSAVPASAAQGRVDQLLTRRATQSAISSFNIIILMY